MAALSSAIIESISFVYSFIAGGSVVLSSSISSPFTSPASFFSVCFNPSPLSTWLIFPLPLLRGREGLEIPPPCPVSPVKNGDVVEPQQNCPWKSSPRGRRSNELGSAAVVTVADESVGDSGGKHPEDPPKPEEGLGLRVPSLGTSCRRERVKSPVHSLLTSFGRFLE